MDVLEPEAHTASVRQALRFEADHGHLRLALEVLRKEIIDGVLVFGDNDIVIKLILEQQKNKFRKCEKTLISRV